MIHILIALVVFLILIQAMKTNKPMDEFEKGDWQVLLIISTIYPIGLFFVLMWVLSEISYHIYEWYDSVEWTKERGWRNK